MPYYLDNAFLLDNPWITVVGCGGTGGFVAEGLCRLFQGREATIVLVDHDRVEPHNLLRQNFYAEDVGRFKSQALADRLARAYRRPVGYSVYAFREEDSGSDGGRYPGLPAYGNSLLIGCADNAAARRAMAESLPGDPRRWLIDAQGAGLACCPGKVDLYPLRRILQLVLLDGPVPGGAHRGLLPCDVDLEVRGGERRWSVTLSFCEFPGADPATGSPVPFPGATKALRPDPYAVSAKSSSGRTFRSASPSTTGTLTSVSLPLEGVTSTWVMSWVAFSSWPPLHLVPLPLVAAVGVRLQRVGGHLLRVLQGHGHLHSPASSSSSLGRPSWCLPTWHCSRSSRSSSRYSSSWASRAMEPVHQPVEVPGTDRKASPTLPRAGVLVVGRLVFFLQIAP